LILPSRYSRHQRRELVGRTPRFESQRDKVVDCFVGEANASCAEQYRCELGEADGIECREHEHRIDVAKKRG
jgi:hypothetical protein